MKYKRTFGSVLADCILYFVMVLVMAVTLFPVLNVVATSLSSPLQVTLGNVYLFPKEFTLASYQEVLKDTSIWRAYANTIFYAVTGTFVSVLFTSMLAYPLSIPTFGLKKTISILLTITMFFGGGMIPTYMVMRWLHMINTVWVMIIPGAVGAWNVFIYKAFFLGIPPSLREAAHIDGANDVGILFRIILPLSKPLLAVMVLFGVVGAWNDFFTALMYLTDSNKYPLQMILRRILTLWQPVGEGSARENFALNLVSPVTIQSTVIVVTTLPIICIYPFLQKYFTKGIMIGSIKA